MVGEPARWRPEHLGVGVGKSGQLRSQLVRRTAHRTGTDEARLERCVMLSRHDRPSTDTAELREKGHAADHDDLRPGQC